MQPIEQTKLWRVENFHCIDLLKATYTTYVFPKHLHETYVIEIVEQGVDEFFCAGTMYTAPAGSIILINPYEVHTGRSAGKSPLVYRCMYPSAALMRKVIYGLIETDCQPPNFTCHVIQDRYLFKKLLQLHYVLENGEDELKCDALLLMTFSYLVQQFSENSLALKQYECENFAIHRVKDCLIENYAEKISLNTLSQFTGISPFYLLRSFRNIFGIPPHEFLTNIRVERAKRLLASDMPIAQVAYETGFCDQSHLTRHFKRLVGLTPGQYAHN